MYVGSGIVNSLINKLPAELHLPGYEFCGPGTFLHQRLSRGDLGKNGLDRACKEHDIAYALNKENLNERHKADNLLQKAAWKRVKSSDANLSEKTAALMVAGIMAGKSKLGLGLKINKKKIRKPTVSLQKGIISKAKKVLKRLKRIPDIREGSNIALIAARKALKRLGGPKKIRIPRVLTLPKSGGILSLAAIFAGLSAVGSLVGGASAVTSAINKSQNAHKQLEEARRHNKVIESINLATKGSGLFLRPHGKGLSIFLKKPAKN